MPELKKVMKRTMPLVAFMKEKVAAKGLAALDATLPWDEAEVLRANLASITAALDLEGVLLATAAELCEDCRPGAPFITFSAEPSLPIALTNNQAFFGAFESSVPVLHVSHGAHDDTAAALARRLERGVKGPVTLYRWPGATRHLAPKIYPSLLLYLFPWPGTRTLCWARAL